MNWLLKLWVHWHCNWHMSLWGMKTVEAVQDFLELYVNLRRLLVQLVPTNQNVIYDVWYIPSSSQPWNYDTSNIHTWEELLAEFCHCRKFLPDTGRKALFVTRYIVEWWILGFSFVSMPRRRDGVNCRTESAPSLLFVFLGANLEFIAADSALSIKAIPLSASWMCWRSCGSSFWPASRHSASAPYSVHQSDSFGPEIQWNKG